MSLFLKNAARQSLGAHVAWAARRYLKKVLNVDKGSVAAWLAAGVSCVNVLMNWALAFYVHLVNKNKVNSDRISKMEQEIDVKFDGISERIVRIETIAQKTPTHDDLAKLYERINQVKDQIGDVAECVANIEGQMNSNNRTMALIHQTLMERK